MNPKSESKCHSGGEVIKHLTARAIALVLCMAAANGPAQTYTILHTFTGGADGGHPGYSALVLSGATLFGTTGIGGTANCGTVFKLDTNGTAYTILKNFTGSDGRNPNGPMVLSGSTLYGMTEGGGSNNWGTVFKLNTDGSGYTVLKHFNGSDGRWPCGGLALANGTLYGTTSSGGDSGDGTVFKLNTDGSGFAVLASFSFSSNAGSDPVAGPVLDGGVLYGTTSDGAYVGGSVYRVNTDGSGFTVLKAFPVSSGRVGIDGIWPCSPLVINGTTLYGTADWGGSGNGTLFRLNADGTGFAVLRHFRGAGDGAGIEAGLLLSGTRLYGTAYEGGDYPYFPPYYGHGAVFCVNTDGTGFIELWQFSGSEGAHPRAGLVMSGSTLFGMTDYGGSADNGVIFTLTVPWPIVLRPPQTQTAELGGAVSLSVKATGDPAPSYQWFFNTTDAISAATTNPCCMLTNVQPRNCGAYSAVVKNLFGAVTSAPAMLNVIPPVERRPVPALDLLGETGSALNVEYADALGSPPNWRPLDTVDLTAAPQLYLDVSAPLPPQRFYRVWQTGTPAAPPALKLPFLVPALTLTGNIGDQLRLDGINQFGPTDAWVNLDTVTLTNTSQLYFDLSAPGQPRRLYRIVPVP